MRGRLLEILACPTCHATLACEPPPRDRDDDVVDGTLRCAGCAASYPIVRGIPRFVPSQDYAASFGYQWTTFAREQIDAANGSRQSEARLRGETGWSPESLAGRWVLDAGCGAGRFVEVASRFGWEVVGVDISDAVDAAAANVAGRPNVHLVQASLFALPLRDASMDACYCIGVVQHTPDPERAVRALPRVLEPGAPIALTVYERRRFTTLNAKYLVRPLTRRIGDRALLALVRAAMPVLFPLTELAFRIPGLGRLFRFAIPVANYVEKRDLSLAERYRWAVLDTFDMLSPRFDAPQREEDVRRALAESGVVDVERRPHPGLNLVGRRGGAPGAA